MINPTVIFAITFTICSIGGLFLIRVLANYVYDTKKSTNKDAQRSRT